MSESYESNGPDNSESPVNQNRGDVVGVHNADSKDDLFVDASDDLDDARNADNRESVASNETETSNYEEKQDANRKENHFVENEYMFGDNQLLADELKRLRDLLEKTTSERDSIEKNYKEERGSIARELATLRNQLKVLTNKELLLGENGGESGDASLRELMSEYSQFLTSALGERSRSESEIRELNAAQYKKDQEIEHLNAKVAELSVSHDVAATYLNSVAGVVSDAQLEKDQYVEVVTDRMLSYLAMVVYQDELLDNSICGKITNVEKSTYFLIETYNQMLYEIYQLGQCLSKTDPNLRVQEQFATVFAAARDELLELKRREVEMVEKVSHLEDENRKFVEQVEKDKQMVETVNAELSKTMTELEQEKMRCANTRDKLSMAVTKGKALVQQRDSLKQSLADKTRELEKCLAELQDKSSALQAAQLSKEEFIKSENLVASLQETLRQSDLILEKSQEVLSETDVPDELQSLDMVEKIKWLVNERNELKVVSLDFYKLKDAISSIDVPETISFPDLESRLYWLKDLFYQAKDDTNVLLDQLDRTKEAARNEIDRLSASLSAELQEKDYIQKELEDLVCKYEDIVKKANKVSLEKDHMVKLLLEESGTTMEDQDVIYHTYSDIAMLIYKCTENIRAQGSASDTSGADSETLQRMQSLLYVRNQELMLCEQILEEETLARFQLNDLPNKLILVSEELGALKEEKDSLLKDLERSEEKSALLREKLSMAVKKGKGLVQDRENLKLQLDEKNSEIEKLKHNLQQLEFTVSECRDQINRLSNDLECIPKLEADLVAMKDQRNQFEQFLSESNNLLQKVIESVDRIVLPVDSVFEEPVEKVNWIAGYINDCQDTKAHLEQELGNVKQEASTLASKLAEAQETMRSLEDALLVAENKISQLADEKKEVEVSKKTVEQELEKEIEEARFQISKFSEACASRKSLEDELSVAENNMSVLISEKEEAQAGRAAAAIELEQVREEFASQTSKLTEAYKTIKSLEDSLSQVEANLTLLIEQNNVKQVGETKLENELRKLKDEAEYQALKLADAHTTIKSLEDALLKAENDISVLQSEKKIVDQEVSTLNSKLNACMEELAGTSGSLESRSVELAGHLNDLQMLMKDERLLSTAKQCFEREIEGLQNLDLIIEDIRDGVVGKGSATIEGNSHASKSFANDLDNIEFDCGEMTGADADNISSRFRKTLEGFEMRSTILTDKFEHFSTSIDEFIATLLRKLQTARDEVVRMTQSMEFLEQKVGKLEVYKQEQEEAMVALQNDVTILLSACNDATRELQFEVNNNLLELKSVPELEKLNHTFFQEEREAGGDDTTEYQKSLEGNKYVETAEKLLFSVRKARTLVKFFDVTSNIAASTIQDLQKKLQEATTTFEKTIDERDLHQNKVSKLEADVVALEYSCRELRLKAADYQAKEKKLKEREAEISLLYDRLSMKEQVTEAEDFLLSLSQMRTLVEKINGIEIPHAELVGDVEPESSAEVKKLFSIINSVTELQHQINLSEQEKQELQLTISTQTAEIEYLKGEVETHIRNKPDLEKMKLEFSEFTFGLEKIVNMLGSNEIIVNQKFSSPQSLLTMLEKQIMTLRSEAENSKSKIQELDSKLLGSQKVVYELTRKVNLPEETLHGSAVQPEIVQERSVFEEPSLPSGSEISEVEDAGTLGQKTISPVSSAAHVRTMRKGSTDHLAINIDSESARLINNEETDEDKGHVFKSLNTSGLIPKQGKMIADRIDGIWVSGGRVLMSRPRARLGLIAYCLFLHMWLLGTIL